MDAEEVGVEESALIAEKTTCVLPTVIGKIAGMQGVTCQKVFERAYARAGDPESYARAKFVHFVSTTDEERVVPDPLAEYCRRAAKVLSQRSRKKRGFCLGCMFNTKAWYGIALSYIMIHPEVFSQPVANHKKATNGKVYSNAELREEIPEVSELDKLWMDLQDSGALDEFDDAGWRTSLPE